MRESNPRSRLAKPMLSRLTNRPFRSALRDLNPRQLAPKASALPDCAKRRLWSGQQDSNLRRTAWKADTLPLSYTRILVFCQVLDVSIQPVSESFKSFWSFLQRFPHLHMFYIIRHFFYWLRNNLCYFFWLVILY